jgi:outer membrane protein
VFESAPVLQIGNCILVAIGAILLPILSWPQVVPPSPDSAWHPAQEQSLRQEGRSVPKAELALSPGAVYSLGELIAFAESHNPETRLAWERARAHAESLGVARSELYPLLTAVALSQTSRSQAYFGTRYYRQTLQDFDLAFDLSYTIFDFGGRSGRINVAKAHALASDFEFNDAHRRVIYRVEAAYYQLLNAVGQEDAARATLSNAQTVEQSAQASLKNGLGTLPDVLEARSATARAQYDLQATLGAEDVARGNLATALGISPQPVSIQSIDRISIPDEFEVSIDEAIDRAVAQRPDMLAQLAEIRSATAQIKEAKSAYFPSLRLHVNPDPQSLYGMQQQFPWGHTAGLDGVISFGLTWTVFDGGARKHSLAQAKDNLQAAHAQAAATRDQIENGVWTAYSDVKTAFRQRESAAAFLEAASQSYNAALESYHYGVRNLLDVTEAQRTLAQARSADISARTQVLATLADLAFETSDSIQALNMRSHP